MTLFRMRNQADSENLFYECQSKLVTEIDGKLKKVSMTENLFLNKMENDAQKHLLNKTVKANMFPLLTFLDTKTI